MLTTLCVHFCGYNVGSWKWWIFFERRIRLNIQSRRNFMAKEGWGYSHMASLLHCSLNIRDWRLLSERRSCVCCQQLGPIEKYAVLTCPQGSSWICAAFIASFNSRQIQSWVFAGCGIKKKSSFFPSELSKFHAKSIKNNAFLTFRAICTVLFLQAQPLLKHMLQGIQIGFQLWHFIKGHLCLAVDCCLSLEWSLKTDLSAFLRIQRAIHLTSLIWDILMFGLICGHSEWSFLGFKDYIWVNYSPVWFTLRTILIKKLNKIEVTFSKGNMK